VFKNGSPNPTFQNQKPKSLKIGWLHLKRVVTNVLKTRGLKGGHLRE